VGGPGCGIGGTAQQRTSSGQCQALPASPEISLVSDRAATPSPIPVFHQALPPEIDSTLPLKQEPIDPRPSYQDLTGLSARRNVLRKAVKALSKTRRHGHRQRHPFRIMNFLTLALGQMMTVS
jgi:hypothetical protein